MSGSLAQFFAQAVGIAQGAAGGALPAMLAQLENAGLSEQVRSWMGHGENLPVTPEQLGGAFTPEQVAHWAKQAGTTPEAMLAVLSEALPAAAESHARSGAPPL